MALTVSADANRPELWRKALYKDVMAELYFMKNKMMGTDDNNIVQLKDDLKGKKGDTIDFSLTAHLTGNGVTGDGELEGNEEAVSSYNETVAIDQLRHAVRLTGALDEQKVAYAMRTDAKSKLRDWLVNIKERMIFLKLAGVNNTTLTNVGGDTVGARCAWSNTPAYIPDADTNAGYGDRYLCADYAAGATSLAATDLITPLLLTMLQTKAKLANPKIVPLRIDGKNKYIVFINPLQAADLVNNAVWAQAQREARERGSSNPIFTDALGEWRNMIIIEHEEVPWLDVSVALHSFRGAAVGTDFAVDACRAILCGRQALALAECTNPNGWVENTKDYKNKTGFATGIIGGMQKTVFNSKEYGVCVLDTAVTALV
jgi:N4-gp56 family major capsid protein